MRIEEASDPEGEAVSLTASILRGMSDGETAISMFDAVGGAEFFEVMVDHFYDAVLLDEVLRPLYPEDLAEARRHTALFLMQYWGGPGTYSEERGHPRLRMRHLPFAIGQPERDAWLRLMLDGLDAALPGIPHPPLAPQIREAIAGYLDHASTAMINQP